MKKPRKPYTIVSQYLHPPKQSWEGPTIPLNSLNHNPNYFLHFNAPSILSSKNHIPYPVFSIHNSKFLNKSLNYHLASNNSNTLNTNYYNHLQVNLTLISVNVDGQTDCSYGQMEIIGGQSANISVQSENYSGQIDSITGHKGNNISHSNPQSAPMDDKYGQRDSKSNHSANSTGQLANNNGQTDNKTDLSNNKSISQLLISLTPVNLTIPCFHMLICSNNTLNSSNNQIQSKYTIALTHNHSIDYYFSSKHLLSNFN